MSRPFLSVVVPALNEEACIGDFIERMRAELPRLVPSWEIVVVDDGSADRTREIVRAHARDDDRIRLVEAADRGKGAALRLGLTAARGEWRFMADADLSMPPNNLRRFLAVAGADPAPDIVIGSRELEGALRVGESFQRYAIGRAFNWAVRCLAVRRIRDTQCGYKLFSAAAVERLIPQLTIDGFAFDVELLLLATREGVDVREVGIVWHARVNGRVALRRGAAAFWDILRIRWRLAKRGHAIWVYGLAMLFAASIAYDLLRMPVQVYDSFGEMLDAQRSPSAWASFVAATKTEAYFRPFRIAQIKMLFDLADGNYWLVYRGFHAVLLVTAFVLFARALRVRSRSDVAAAAFALTAAMGMYTFLGLVQEAFPINHFLEVVVCCLIALNLAQSRGGWLIDVVATLTFAGAALTLESGLLVWVIAVSAWLVGMRGISRRGLLAMTILLGGYFYVRFVYLGSGAPSLSERSAGFWLSRLEPDELEARFGARPIVFYAYNVAASASAVLFSEPRNGVFGGVAGWLAGDVPPRIVLALVSSTSTTLAIAWAAVRSLRMWRMPDESAQLIAVFVAVLAANATLSYAYTKDEIMSVAGVFYAIAAFAALRAALARSRRAAIPTVAVLGILLTIAGGAWAVRSAGVHHILRLQSFRHRGDWAMLPFEKESVGQVTDEKGKWLRERLRNDALATRAPNPYFYPRWTDRVWGD